MYKDIATKIAWSYLGTPYLWGGDDFSGFDCSGFVLEILKSVARFPMGEDTTAYGLYLLFKHCEVNEANEGCLVFWGKDKNNIRHVEYCLNDELSIGASGGGSKTKTKEDAIKQNAYIKVRPIFKRGTPVAIVDPFCKART